MRGGCRRWVVLEVACGRWVLQGLLMLQPDRCLSPLCQWSQVLNLPSSLAYPLFHKLAAKGEERVVPGALLQWASAHNLCGTAEARRAFDILRQARLRVRSQLHALLLLVAARQAVDALHPPPLLCSPARRSWHRRTCGRCWRACC